MAPHNTGHGIKGGTMWTEGEYGTWNYNVAGFTGSVSWAVTGGGFVGSFNGWRLKQRYPDCGQAKAAVVRLATRKAAELTAAIAAAAPVVPPK